MKASFAIGIAAILITTGVFAQGNQKQKGKQDTTKGAVQMPGDNGKIGTSYMLGAKGNELVFTLEKAEFAERFLMQDRTIFATEGQRLVILTYSVQNPSSKDERMFFNQSLSFTVVSPDDENFECDGLKANGWQGVHPDRRNSLNISLKPAQKVKALAAVQIHQKGPINKLIVQRGKGTPVLRYDLKGKVGAMSGVFADNGGQDSFEVGVGKVGQQFELGVWDITLESVEELPGKIGPWEADRGKYVVVTMVFANMAMYPMPMHSTIMTYRMMDTDGAEIPYAWKMLKGSDDDQYNGTLEAGGKCKVRVLFDSSPKAKANSFTIKDQQQSGRSVKFQLGGD